MHHSIGDALAAAYLIRDLVGHLAGRPMPPPLPDRPSMADELIERCRHERTTVQGALTAALTIAVAESGRAGEDGTVRCLSPINVRYLCPPVADDFGLYLASAKTTQRPAHTTSMWQMARSTRAQIAAGANRERLIARATAQQAMLADVPTPRTAFAAYRRSVDHQLVVSNIGRLAGETDHGTIRLEAVWLLPNLEAEPIIGVATVNRRMCVTLLSRGARSCPRARSAIPRCNQIN